MFEIRYGNLLAAAAAGEFNAIFHGCNCFGKMKRGIAGQIATIYPSATAVDRARTVVGDKSKLGTATVTSEPCSRSVRNLKGIVIINNVYTQFDYGNEAKQYFIPAALEQYLNKLAEKIKLTTEQERLENSVDGLLHLGFPAIGCGLGRGSFTDLERILRDFSLKTEGYTKVTLMLTDR
jgi:O-acetyl-ADP-ribose deacetylase (regulator of RNase III)